MILKGGAHTTISGDRLQNELVIGRVGVFGNLGKEKLINNPESTSEGDLSSGTRLSKARVKPVSRQNTRSMGSGSGYHVHAMLRRTARVQILERYPAHIFGVKQCSGIER
jgi:hypothetical protein